MCLYPKLIKNRRYIANKKNGGVIPPVTDKRTLMVPVGCQKCIECMKQKARNWQVRLLEDVRHNKNGIFVTLTFSNEAIKELSGEIKGLEGYELDNEIAVLGMRRFLERWRKKYKKSVRHWMVTELGHRGTENIHMHGIIWTDIEREEITKIWGYGYTWLSDKRTGYVNEQTVNYITKYINKIDEKHKEYKPRVLTSNGIGSNYLKRQDSERNKYKEKGTQEAYINRQGYKMNLPIYYRNKIYSEEEREKLWTEKLDKKERWVCGEKIDISKGEEGYYKILQYHRARNQRLGYGTDEINWDRKRYENDRRNKLREERTEKVTPPIAEGKGRPSTQLVDLPTIETEIEKWIKNEKNLQNIW